MPFVIFQTKEFMPVMSPVTRVPEDAVSAIIPAPEITDQLPIPTSGTFPFKVALVAQIVVSFPAIA